ncbi:MAG: hypothetical protein EBT02_11075, partial [Planctomycetia bacterium]|nr:hypothetical protein [Planctomycetia bacterium]
MRKVQGKHPIPSFPFLFSSFSAKAGNPERQSAKNGPALCSEGDEGEWAMVTMVRGKHPFRHSRFSFRHSLRKQGIQK